VSKEAYPVEREYALEVQDEKTSLKCCHRKLDLKVYYKYLLHKVVNLNMLLRACALAASIVRFAFSGGGSESTCPRKKKICYKC